MSSPPTMDPASKAYWQRCSSCKKEISYRGKYYICSVSTCQSKKLGLHFCSVPCWDSHLGFARHRDAGALDAMAPSREEYLNNLQSEPPAALKPEGIKKMDNQSPSSASPSVPTLVVVSKIKQLIRDQSAMNTSQDAIDALTQKVVQECMKAIENAKTAGRKTVMGRDFE